MGCGASAPAQPGATLPSSPPVAARPSTSSGKRKSRADRQAERLSRMKYPEQAAALAKELAEQLREEEQKQEEAVQSENVERNETETTLESVELIEQMMVGVTDQARAILDADRCTLWLVNTKTQEMWSFLSDVEGSGNVKMHEEEPDDATPADRVLRVKVGTGLAGSCAATGKVIEVLDAVADDRFDSSHDAKTGYHTKAVACVPILKAPKRRTRAQRKLDRLNGGGSQRDSFKGANARESRVVGVMQVLNRKDGKDGGFDSKAVKSLAKLATDAGLVLQATKLYREITGLYDMASGDGYT